MAVSWSDLRFRGRNRAQLVPQLTIRFQPFSCCVRSGQVLASLSLAYDPAMKMHESAPFTVGPGPRCLKWQSDNRRGDTAPAGFANCWCVPESRVCMAPSQFPWYPRKTPTPLIPAPDVEQTCLDVVTQWQLHFCTDVQTAVSKRPIPPLPNTPTTLAPTRSVLSPFGPLM